METVYSVPKNENYRREELEKKTLKELKDIGRNLNLSISGKKADLIDRILTNQQTYFELLPRDVLNMVEEYKITNNPNNKFLLFLLNSMKEDSEIEKLVWSGKISRYSVERKIWQNSSNVLRDENFINQFFKSHDLDIKFTGIKRYSNYNEILNVGFGRLPLIDDKLMAEILLMLAKNGQYISTLNTSLYRQNMPFLLGEIHQAPRIIVMYDGQILI